MAENSFPFYGVETSETQFSQWGDLLMNSGVVSGLELTAGAGMSVNVAAGIAMMRGRYYENTTPKNVAISAAPGAGLTRKDYIILKIDLTANSVIVTKKDGTTAGGGTLPALQQDTNVWELPIGVVTVASGVVSIAGAMIAAKRPFAPLRVFPYASEDDRPTPVLSVLALGVNTSTRILELWVGGSWVSLTPDVTWAGITGKPATFAPSAHTHAYADITGKPATFAPSAHDHDDRYYQKATVDAMVAAKAALAHTHAYADITGKPATFPPSGHDHAQLTFGGGIIFAWDSSRWWTPQQLTGGNLQTTGGNSYDIVTSRRAVWMDANGILGYASSSRKGKQDIHDTMGEKVPEGGFEFTLEQLALLRVVTFRYKKAVAESRKKDSKVRAQREIGMIAEELHDAGLWPFVMYERDENDEPQPIGIHYEVLSIAAIAYEKLLHDELALEIVKRVELERKIDELAAAVAKLTKKETK